MELEQETRLRLSSTLTSRFATSLLTFTLNLPAETLYAFGRASASITWNVVTGSKSNAPVPSASKL